MTTKAFVSRWGIPELDDYRWLNIPGFIMRHWAKFVSIQEWSFILQIMSFKYDSDNGEASPSLETITTELGYKNVRSVQTLKKKLQNKELLDITERSGLTDIYDFKKFALKCLDEEMNHSSLVNHNTPVPLNQDSGGVVNHDSPKESEDKNQNLEESESYMLLCKTVFLFLIYSGYLKPKPEIVQKAEEHIQSLDESVEESPEEEIPPEAESDSENTGGLSAKELQDQYMEVVRRADAPPGKPLKHSGVVANRVKSFRGLWVEGEKDAGPERLAHQFKENPPSPAEIIAMTLWYRPTYKQEKLPTTLSTLRKRFDEFRATSDYEDYVAEGEKRLVAIMADTNNAQLEETATPAFDYENAPPPPPEDDMEPFDWEEFFAQGETENEG